MLVVVRVVLWAGVCMNFIRALWQLQLLKHAATTQLWPL
jgi:hypothetical protein